MSNIIRFAKGENHAACRVTILDDSLFEEEEGFFVELSDVKGGKLGSKVKVEVNILPDPADGR